MVDILITKEANIEFYFRVHPLDEELARANLENLKVLFRPWIDMIIEANEYFKKVVPKVFFVRGEFPKGFNRLGEAHEEGISIFLNTNNRILEYNCIAHASIFHEYAHWLDLSERDRNSLRPILPNELKARLSNPVYYGKILYNEYQATKQLPMDDILSLKLIVAANLLGKEGDAFFIKMEERYPHEVTAQVFHPFNRLVDLYLPTYLCEPEEQQKIFLSFLQKVSNKAYGKWLSMCHKVKNNKPVDPNSLTEELLITLIGMQMPPKDAYLFAVGIFPTPSSFYGKPEVKNLILNQVKKYVKI